MLGKVSAFELSELAFHADGRLYVSHPALWTNYALNIVIGLQVFLGALTTGIAAGLTNARQVSFIRTQP